jgi:hypothetical protein
MRPESRGYAGPRIRGDIVTKVRYVHSEEGPIVDIIVTPFVDITTEALDEKSSSGPGETGVRLQSRATNFKHGIHDEPENLIQKH